MIWLNRLCTAALMFVILWIAAAQKLKKTEKRSLEVLAQPGFLVWGMFLAAFVFIRLIALDRVPGGINQDEAMGAVDALALSKYGTDRFGTFMPAHFTAWGFGQMSVLQSYLMVPFIKLFGFHTFIVRLPIFLLSLAGAAAVYFFTKRTFGEKAAFITLAFLAVNPWHFMQGRWALDCNAFPHMFIIGFCLLVAGLEKTWLLYLAMVFFALSMYSYGVAFFMVPFFLLIACAYLLMIKKLKMRQVLVCALIYLIVAFPICGTMLINYMGWETVKLPFVTMPYFENSVRSGDILFFSKNIPQQLWTNIQALVRVVFLQSPDLPWNAIDAFGTVYKMSMPLIAVGIGVCVYIVCRGKEEKKRILCSLLLLYWIFCLFEGCCINSVNINRINIIFYSHIIFAGIGISFLVRKWRPALWVVLGIFAVQSFLFFNTYFTTWSDQIEDHFYKDFLEAVEFAGTQEADYYYITPDTQYEGSSNVSEILTQYVLRIDAEYTQGKTDTFFGREMSYRDRFHFENPDVERLNNWDDIVYVIKTENVRYYHLDAFRIKTFGDYSVAVPTQNAEF